MKPARWKTENRGKLTPHPLHKSNIGILLVLVENDPDLFMLDEDRK